MQPQAAGDNVADGIGQPQIIEISIGAQPHECVPEAGAELLGEHPGGLVDLGPVQCQVRGLATGPARAKRSPPAWSRASSSRTVAVSAKISASPGGNAVSGPGRSRYRPSTPARIAPIRSGNAKIAAAPA